MANENSDLEPVRSRSIFRQVRETFSGINRSRHRVDTRHGSSPLTLINTDHKSSDSLHGNQIQNKNSRRKSTTISFTHHLSLLNQVKSHITKSKKSHPTSSSSLGNDEFTRLSFLSTDSIPVSRMSFYVYSFINICKSHQSWRG